MTIEQDLLSSYKVSNYFLFSETLLLEYFMTKYKTTLIRVNTTNEIPKLLSVGL